MKYIFFVEKIKIMLYSYKVKLKKINKNFNYKDFIGGKMDDTGINFKKVLNTLEVPLAIIDNDLIHIFANKEYLKYFNTNLNLIENKCILDFFEENLLKQKITDQCQNALLGNPGKLILPSSSLLMENMIYEFLPHKKNEAFILKIYPYDEIKDIEKKYNLIIEGFSDVVANF